MCGDTRYASAKKLTHQMAKVSKSQRYNIFTTFLLEITELYILIVTSAFWKKPSFMALFSYIYLFVFTISYIPHAHKRKAARSNRAGDAIKVRKTLCFRTFLLYLLVQHRCNIFISTTNKICILLRLLCAREKNERNAGIRRSKMPHPA